MVFKPLAVVLVIALCVLYTGRVEAASLTRIDCTKCRLDVYSFGSKDYDCGVARHTKLPICTVDCKILYDTVIPIPNLNLDFDLNTCVESSVVVVVTTTTTTTTVTPMTSAPASQ